MFNVFQYQQQPFQAMARPPNTLQYQYTFPTMNQHAFGQYGKIELWDE